MKKSNGQSISVIGLGSMGSALAETLLKSDFNVSVWNRTLLKSKKLENQGANICSSPNDAFKNSQFIIASLSNYEAWNNIINSNQIDMDLSGKTIIQLVRRRLIISMLDLCNLSIIQIRCTIKTYIIKRYVL